MTLAADIEKIKRARELTSSIVRATYAYDIIRQLTDIVKQQHESLLEDACGICDGTGEVFDEASNLMGHHGWVTCWTCYETKNAKALALSAPIVKGME